MSIRVLPSNLVNQIAAGEVIERPASVVKELVENSLDAGAKRIEITLKGGGKNLIIIEDDGKGMDKEDLALATERHATSKLPSDDLFNVQFLGFRGEAIPSIASVSKMKISTRTKDSTDGWEIEIKGGEKSEIRPCSKAKGTRIEVRDLFYATPARLKFLKTDTAEAGACADIISRIALANPDVSFYLYADDKKKISYEVRDNLLRFYYAYIYKNKSALQMLGAEAFYEEYIEHSIVTFISHRFEEIARTYFSLCVQKRKMRGISNIGTFYYDNSAARTNGEFDVVLERKDSYDIYEVKYYSWPMRLQEMRKEEEQVRTIKGLCIGRIGFIATAGYESTPEEFDCINAEALYEM